MRIAEADLGFGRMDIDVHVAERHAQKKKRLGRKSLFQKPPISLVQGGRQDFVPDRPAVDEKELVASGPAAPPAGGRRIRTSRFPPSAKSTSISLSRTRISRRAERSAPSGSADRRTVQDRSAGRGSTVRRSPG